MTFMARTRRAVVAVCCAIALGLGVLAVAGAGQAQAATSTPSATQFAAATSYQNSTIARAIARRAGGTRVSAGEVVWGNGALILKVPASPAAQETPGVCVFTYICTWNTPDYTGSEYEAQDAPYGGTYWFPVGAFLNAEQSVINNTNYRYWMHSQDNGTGSTFCINPFQEYGFVPTSNDHDYWGQITVNPNNCP